MTAKKKLFLLLRKLSFSRIPRNRMYDRFYLVHTYVSEVMNGHEQTSYNFFRMPTITFKSLLHLLKNRHLIADFRNMTTSEQVVMFIQIIAHADNYRSIYELFQHSLETISRIVFYVQYSHLYQSLLN